MPNFELMLHANNHTSWMWNEQICWQQIKSCNCINRHTSYKEVPYLKYIEQTYWFKVRPNRCIALQIENVLTYYERFNFLPLCLLCIFVLHFYENSTKSSHVNFGIINIYSGVFLVETRLCSLMSQQQRLRLHCILKAISRMTVQLCVGTWIN